MQKKRIISAILTGIYISSYSQQGSGNVFLQFENVQIPENTWISDIAEKSPISYFLGID